MTRSSRSALAGGAGAVAVAILAATPLAGGAASVAAGMACAKPAGAKLIASDDGSKAWRVTIDGGAGAPDLRRYGACQRGRAPFVFERGDTGADSLLDVPAAAIADRQLAYGRTRKFGLGTSRATIIVRDLRTHRVTYVRRAVSEELELESFHRVAVRSSGGVAWIASNIVGDEGTSVYEVRKHEPGSGTKLLDKGTDIAPLSLRLLGAGRVRWVRNGVVKNAPLS
jgi:hypothetical protein